MYSEELGRLKNIKAWMKDEPKHRLLKARPITLAHKPAVERGLDQLEARGIVKRVTHSEWAALIVTPVTINPQLDVGEYLSPRIEEIYANLSGDQQFNVIGLRLAYLQMEVEEQSKHYLIVNTRLITSDAGRK